MKIIIPCCDTVYYNGLPRCIAIDNNNLPLIYRIILSINNYNNIIIGLYQEQEIKYNISNIIKSLFGDKIQFCIFDKIFKSQSETIVEIIKNLNINDSIFIKDNDSEFNINLEDKNYGFVCVDSLNNFKKINVNDKSYIQTDHNDFIINMREKTVISNLFSVGGYYFPNSQDFINCFNSLHQEIPFWHNKIFISDIIGLMVLNGFEFKTQMVENYKDYGTIEEWLDAIKSY